MPSAYRFKNPSQDDELGFVPLALAAAPAIGGIAKGIGGLFKKKKKAAPAPAPKAAGPARAGSVSKSKAASSGTASHAAAPQVAGLAAVPADVKMDALAALKSYQKTNQASAAKQAALVKKLAKVVQPQVAAMKAQVAQQALKQQVTSEHNKIVKNDERWAANDAAHKAIMAKFDQLEAALLGSNATTKRVFKIYGVNA
jgi:hypothetical protein